MAMNPDIQDPAWIKSREKAWKRIKSNNRGVGLSGKDLEFIRRVCFGERVEDLWDGPGGMCPYWVSFWHYFPIQNHEFWREVLVHQRPRYQVKRGVESQVAQAARAGRDYSDWNDGYCGWDLETSIEFGRYIFGDRYKPEGYTFEGIAMPYPNPPGKIYIDWLRSFSVWSDSARPDAVALHQLELWVSVLPLVPGFLFSRRPSSHRDLMIAQKQLSSLLSLLARPVETSLELFAIDGIHLSDSDMERRVSVLMGVRDRLLQSDVRYELRSAIELYDRNVFATYAVDEDAPLMAAEDLSESEVQSLFRI